MGIKETAAWAIAILCAGASAIAGGTGFMWLSDPAITQVGPVNSVELGIGCMALAALLLLATMRITHPYRR